MCMFYIDNFDNYPNKYLAYIYYNYNDLYFLYDYDDDTEKTKLYDIGNLEPYEIENLFNDNIQKIRGINTPALNNKIPIHRQIQGPIHRQIQGPNRQNFHHGNNLIPSYQGTKESWINPNNPYGLTNFESV